MPLRAVSTRVGRPRRDLRLVRWRPRDPKPTTYGLQSRSREISDLQTRSESTADLRCDNRSLPVVYQCSAPPCVRGMRGRPLRGASMGGLNAPMRILLIVTVLAGIGAACGDDDDAATTTTSASTSEQAVCAARQELHDSIEAVFEDLSDADIDAARSGLDDVQAAVDEVGEARGELSEEQQARIEPLIDQVRSGLESLDSASSLEEFGSALDDAGSAIDDIDNELGAVCG